MQAEGVKTRILKIGESILPFLVEATSHIGELENCVLCITSKIISLSESRVVSKDGVDKKSLIKKEADRYLADGPYGVSLTIKHGLMIPSAGIDESNSQTQEYILYPKDPYRSAKEIWSGMRKHFSLKNFGVIITDSHTQPLRRGVVGVALAYWGFKGVNNLVGKEDLFGRPLKFTTVHVADALAVTGVYLMGEANEARPLALIRDSGVTFAEETNPKEGMIEPENDLYFSLYGR